MNPDILAELGWSNDFLRQLDLDEAATVTPARVTAVHRARIEAMGADGALDLIPNSNLSTADVAVGDWLLAKDGVALRILDRHSLVARKAAGSAVARQLIAANLDSLLVVSSCNADFNAARLERFLVLAASAGVEPVVVLTKADTCPDPDVYLAQARALKRGLAVVALDAKRADVRKVLSAKAILYLQKQINMIEVGPLTINYVARLVRATRPGDDASPKFVRELIDWGAGPRAGMFLIAGGKAIAAMDGRPSVSLQDIRRVAIPVLRHRIATNFQAQAEGMSSDAVVARLLDEIPEPKIPKYV